jgi:putative hydrolase of the HAD superfamily
MRLAGTSRKESIMIGDNLVADILGAKNVGIDQVYFNPEKNKHQEKVSYEISSLDELSPLLL